MLYQCIHYFYVNVISINVCVLLSLSSQLLYQHIGHCAYFKEDLVIFVLFNTLCIYFPLFSTPNLFNKQKSVLREITDAFI